MDKTQQGYVYILTNPSFREDWIKIGKSIRPVDIRSKELDNTAVPLPFEIYATMKTAQYDKVEKHMHKTIDRLTNLHIRKNREFFNIKPEVALDILRDIAEITPDAEIVLYKDNKPIVPLVHHQSPGELEEPKKKQSRFCFSLVGIRVGEPLIFVPTGIEVRVASNNTIEYQGKEYKLSPFVREFIPEKNSSGAYQGALYFSYKGKKLTQLREEFEGKSDVRQMDSF